MECGIFSALEEINIQRICTQILCFVTVALAAVVVVVVAAFIVDAEAR